MDTLHEVLIPDVTPEQLAHLFEMFRGEGGTVIGGDAGFLENACFAAKFDYNKGSRLLILEPLRQVESLTPRRLRRIAQQMIAPPLEPVVLASGETIYEPTPHGCAIYNWAIGFFTNNSGGVLTYSGSKTDHGTLDPKITKIDPGAKPSDHKDGFWRNKAGKDSGLGCYGSISYQLADGITTLTVYYGVNTLTTTSASAALSGQNAARYSATCDTYTHYSGKYVAAYLYPYITLSKV